MANLNQLLKVCREAYGLRVMDSIMFGNSGKGLSVQCSPAHYCSPRVMADIEVYDTFEVMAYLDEEDVPESWSEYGSLDDVYSYVPRQMIEDLINELIMKYGDVVIGG